MGDAQDKYYGEEEERRMSNDPGDESRSETIKERIDRETKEQIEAGRGAPTYFNREESAYAEGLRDGSFDASYEANVLFDYNGNPVGAELLKNGEPFYQLKMHDERLATPSEHELQTEYARGYSDAVIKQKLSSADRPELRFVFLPGPYTSKAIEDVTGTLGARGHSYTVDNEFQNFQEQAREAEQTMRQVFLGALAQKKARERATRHRLVELEEAGDVESDSYHELYLQWLDSIRDVCGYGLLYFGWAKSEFDQLALKS